MKYVSEKFAEAMKSRPYIARITLDSKDVIQGDPIKNIMFRGGSNGDADAVSIGCVVASSVEIELDKTLVEVTLTDRSMDVSLGIDIDGSIEWISMGAYKITDVQGDDDTITVNGLDPAAEHFEAEYEDIEGIDFSSAEGVSAKTFVDAVCSRHGISADLWELEDIMLTGFNPEGLTDRQLIGMVAGLYGRFAAIGRDGVLRFSWYKNVDAEITGDDYYEGGLEKAEYGFSVAWLKCYNEVLEETLIEGDPDAAQGIYFSCPWMTQERLELLWETIRGFSYVPVSGLSFLGDPRLEAGDIITVTNLAGESFRVPIMTISHEYDGGLKTEISAQGQSTSDTYEGPVQRETKRTIAKIVKTQNGIEMSVANAQNEISYLQLTAEDISARVKDAEGNVSDLQIRADEVEAAVQDAAGNLANLQVQADEIAGKVENAEGDITLIKQTAGHVSVEAEDEAGKLETQINAKAWIAKRTDTDGKVTSAFYFDFEVGQFVFDGTGKFMSPDGKSYITLEGSEFVMYAQAGDDGEMIDIARIGFTEDSEGYDYPYFLMGNADAGGSNFDKIGLVKMFRNGLYAGNSAPRNSTGSFLGLSGAAGFFVDTLNAVAYVVSGEEMKELYTGTVDATFA